MPEIKNYRRIGKKNYRITIWNYQGRVQATAYAKNSYGQEYPVAQVYGATEEEARAKLVKEVA